MNKTTEYIHRRETATSEATLSATLTSMFGAKASPKAARYAAASVRKGIHLYSEEDILRSCGTKKAKQLCKDPQYDIFQGEAIDQTLHEEWRIHKAAKMLEEERETKEATEALLQEYPNLEAVCKTK